MDRSSSKGSVAFLGYHVPGTLTKSSVLETLKTVTMLKKMTLGHLGQSIKFDVIQASLGPLHTACHSLQSLIHSFMNDI